MDRLIHIQPEIPGYIRKGFGKGFAYFDESGRKITSDDQLKRIQSLRIPPAWKNVWICPKENGHLQATGKDARGRKQYIYHEVWNANAQEQKFEKMIAFAKALPELRKRIARDLNKKGWPPEKVMALVVQILDDTQLRIGNKAYEQENGTYGITTLKRRHLKLDNQGVIFQFKGKSGLYRKTRIKSKKLSRLIRECSELPGQEVFQYLDQDNKAHPIYSQDVNAYIKSITNDAFTAKDFRTWGGTVWAIELFPEAFAELESSAKKSLTTSVVRKVAEKLGNTIAVCKSYYIHPCVLNKTEEPDYEIEKLYHKAKMKYRNLSKSLSQAELIALYLIEQEKA